MVIRFCRGSPSPGKMEGSLYPLELEDESEKAINKINMRRSIITHYGTNKKEKRKIQH